RPHRRSGAAKATRQPGGRCRSAGQDRLRPTFARLRVVLRGLGVPVRASAVLTRFEGVMAKRLVMVGALGLTVGFFFWWVSSGGQKPTAAAAALVDRNADDHEGTAGEEAVITQVTPPAKNASAFDPVVIGPCNVVPYHEQNVSSQVDGVLEEVRVDLGDVVKR